MTGSDDRTILPFPNAFTRPFLDRLGELDEPPTAGEADIAGPWEVEEIPGFGYGLFRAGETWERHFQPVAVFHRRPVALLAAAVLPGTGRDAAFRLADKLTAAGFAITDSSGQLAGHSALFNEPLIAALHKPRSKPGQMHGGVGKAWSAPGESALCGKRPPGNRPSASSLGFGLPTRWAG